MHVHFTAKQWGEFTTAIYLFLFLWICIDLQEQEWLRAIFLRLTSAALKLSPKKCQRFQRRGSFLGHIVSDEGVLTDPEKISAVREWPTPHTPTAMRSFLDLCFYDRRFVKVFTSIASHLYRLTEKGRAFAWTEKCDVAFQRLKQALTEVTIVAYTTLEDSFVLDTMRCQQPGCRCRAFAGARREGEGDRLLSPDEIRKTLLCNKKRTPGCSDGHESFPSLPLCFKVRTDHGALDQSRFLGNESRSNETRFGQTRLVRTNETRFEQTRLVLNKRDSFEKTSLVFNKRVSFPRWATNETRFRSPFEQANLGISFRTNESQTRSF